jgi:hypothetical protein
VIRPGGHITKLRIACDPILALGRLSDPLLGGEKIDIVEALGNHAFDFLLGIFLAEVARYHMRRGIIDSAQTGSLDAETSCREPAGAEH